jgi:hypothetical protein
MFFELQLEAMMILLISVLYVEKGVPWGMPDGIRRSVEDRWKAEDNHGCSGCSKRVHPGWIGCFK